MNDPMMIIGVLFLTAICLLVGAFVGYHFHSPPPQHLIGHAGYIQLRCHEKLFSTRDNREFFCEYLVPANSPNSARPLEVNHASTSSYQTYPP
jgi:hypothetical protein